MLFAFHQPKEENYLFFPESKSVYGAERASDIRFNRGMSADEVKNASSADLLLGEYTIDGGKMLVYSSDAAELILVFGKKGLRQYFYSMDSELADSVYSRLSEDYGEPFSCSDGMTTRYDMADDEFFH